MKTPDDKTPETELEVRHYAASEIWARFWPLVRPHLWRCALAGLLVSVVGIAVAVMPLFPKYVIDVAIPAKDNRLALIAAVCFLIVQFTRMGLWYVAMLQVYKVQQRVVFALRAQGFSHLQSLCLRFHNRYPSGFLYERVFGNSINTLGMFTQVVFQQLVTMVTGFIFSLGFCLYISPVLTLVIILGASGYVFAARKMSKRIYQRTKSSNEAHMRIVEMIMDRLRGQKTIKAMAMEETVQQEFERELWPVMVKWLDAVMENTKLSFVSEGLSYLITAVVIVGSAALVMGDEITTGEMVAFMGYQGTLIGMIQALTNVYGQCASAKSAFDQLYTVLDTDSTVRDVPGAAMPATIEGNLEFRNVSFSYTDKPVIRDLSFTLPKGQTIALVGRSGSGKTTITNLLMRFYEPDAGSIHLDGHDIRQLPLRGYRQQFGVVLQDPYLFDTSVANNLRYARPDATEAQIIEALKQAKAWEFVSDLKEGLNHRVGEVGSLISGGQRQRLAVARCLLLNSRFVLLDEATSALDAETEMVIQDALQALFKQRTAVIIAHRLSTIRFADRILVMDQGQLVEEGTFKELLERKGLFHRLHSIATSTSSRHLKIEEAGFA